MKTTSIQTTQFVTIDYRLATIGDRIFAAIIDCLVFFGTYYVLIFVVARLLDAISFGAGQAAGWLLGFMPIFGFLVYHFLSLTFMNGQTIGKRTLGIRVIRHENYEPSMTDFALRSLFLLPDLLLTSGLLGLLTIIATEDRQRFGDLLAGTLVIRQRSFSKFQLPQLLKVESAAEFESEYDNILDFTEEDMLIIKRAISLFEQNPNKAHRQAVDKLVAKVAGVLEVEPPTSTSDQLVFLRGVLSDYIISTR